MSVKIMLQEWGKEIIKDPNKIAQIDVSNESTLIQKLAGAKIIKILELKHEILVQSFAYVGRIKIGNLEITITPKIDSISLIKLLDYTFDLNLLTKYSNIPHTMAEAGFVELLIYRLAREVNEVINRGINKAYILREEKLNLLRGSIIFNQLVQQSANKLPQIPCRYFNRIEDTRLNQILLSGSLFAKNKSSSTQIKNEFRVSIAYLQETVTLIRLNRQIISTALNQINRLSNYYRNVLNLIKFLYSSSGIILKEEDDKFTIEGFLLNMNRFFQNLLEKFLYNNVTDYKVYSELQIQNFVHYNPHFNPKLNRDPKPRPDFSLNKDGNVILFLDAKYIDLWGRDIPSYIIYQLSTYALSLENQPRVAIVLYPAIDNSPQESVIEIGNPENGERKATIIFRPVNLTNLTHYIENKSDSQMRIFAEFLTNIHPQKPK